VPGPRIHCTDFEVCQSKLGGHSQGLIILGQGFVWLALDAIHITTGNIGLHELWLDLESIRERLERFLVLLAGHIELS
jgi:hypothetical protein